MNNSANRIWFLGLSAAGLAVGIWLAGFLLMRLPAGEQLLRYSYDCFHIFTSHQADPRILIIALNENTDRKLGRRQGEPFSRLHHARLLERLKQAGAERVCFDILFDLPSSDPKADQALINAVKAHGHVILGGAEENARRDRSIRQNSVIAPLPALRAAAEGWGLLNVAVPDDDGVVRRFTGGSGIAPPLAAVAAAAETGEQMAAGSGPLWLYYQNLPGGIPSLEFSDCLNPEIVSDDMLRGKTVFIGGQYASDEYGRRDVFRTPYSRFGAPDISGVAWHATAFLNARDNLWFVPAGTLYNAAGCLPFALASLLVFAQRKRHGLHFGVILGIWLLLAVLLAVASIFFIWNDRVLVNWTLPLLVQFPLCVGALLMHRMLRPRVKFLMAPLPRELEHITVFISFSSKDEALASELQQFLKDNGQPAWLCKEHIESGGVWADAIAAAIERCRVVLFVLSKDSLASEYCLDEITMAKKRKKRIIPLRIDNTPLSGRYELHLAAAQEIDGRNSDHAALFPRVIASVNRVLAVEQPAPPKDKSD
jgi:CHASE2 domain-containing sensor protein